MARTNIARRQQRDIAVRLPRGCRMSEDNFCAALTPGHAWRLVLLVSALFGGQVLPSASATSKTKASRPIQSILNAM